MALARRNNPETSLEAMCNIVVREPENVYRAKSKQYLTSHQLADFRKCPALFRRKQLGLIRDEDRPAYALGRAAHTLILEGREKYEREYAIGGPVNPRTGNPYGSNTKAFQEWAEAQSRPVLSDNDALLIENLAASVKAHPASATMLSIGMAEAVVRAEYLGLPCQIRVDWFNPDAGIVDLKTCASLSCFEFDIRAFDYGHQMAFYRAVLAVASGQVLPGHIVAVEKQEPDRTGIFKIGENLLHSAEAENVAAVGKLKQCIQDDNWPTLYEEIKLINSL